MEIPTVADALVIAFQEFPALKTACPEVHGELIAVQQALEDVSGEKYDDAWGKVKGIGSPLPLFPMETVYQGTGCLLQKRG